ncbi:MAG: GGDEF domain-containing protein [Zetaproteobacteria bacterium CG_4_9_14_3_um_filter_49_83]|nr:MAG: hypothetical protein AUJ56_12625 [Zetaproteobacteria bacterium CG1_02_49_23]PIQ34345.1 MAG: GGDEF domain-containing protein [Zetaproteobacteria bacterium CG17_big_fil_post_rev_8_21_14_2_50_50_13]PIV29908.1 MAG: GGDEF domain-containing protein [Zetaproteobacteria bacterium CG02_land_8_20_14_3_00_50_9]PIY56155.1 MAG: GGDEF domain-containing protein [Zetaproteobacteria bacterium CG_4_10_14_0_8_um_filter_49_80]PJA35379.1 MAG: GGDEF domain-containing protein [Zetaproteobacteria bacterium CG_
MLANVLIIFGTLVLVASLLPVRQLLLHLPKSSLRTHWYSLILLIGLFIIGYAGYGIQFWSHNLHNDLHDKIVPVIFFCGAIFVWLTCTLSLRTALDLRRMVLLEQENITDPLIGIYNRRYLDRRLTEEVARATRYVTPLSVMMIDIDHFKTINDVYGHQAGDRVLSYLGGLILDAIRQTDVAARYGGEELMIIAPETSAHTAENLAERLRKRIESHELVLASETSGRQSIHITVSIGVAEMKESRSTPEQIIACCDEALYRAKEGGRNRVVVY